jgi:hypothetical protein
MSNLFFAAPITVAVNPETGEEFLLRTDKEFAEYEQVALADMEERLRARDINGATKQYIESQRKMETAMIRASYERQKKDRDDAKPNSTVHKYQLRKPDYGEFVRAESLATQPDVNGLVTFDQNAFAELILPEAVFKEDKVTQVDMSPGAGVSIIVGRELRGRLLRAIFPDAKRLPFTVLASDPTSKIN